MRRVRISLLRDGRPRTADAFAAPVQDRGVDHRRLHTTMPKQLLNRAGVIAIFNEDGWRRKAGGRGNSPAWSIPACLAASLTAFCSTNAWR